MRFTYLIVLFVFYLILLSACKTESYDCAFFDNMHKVDQEIRSDKRVNVLLNIADSLKLEDEEAKYKASIDFQREAYTIYKNAGFQRHLFLDTIIADSLELILVKNDKENTRSLLNAIKYSDKAKLDTSSCFNSALIVFAHTPMEQIEEVAESLEYIKDIISENRYDFLKRSVDSTIKLKEEIRKQNIKKSQ